MFSTIFFYSQALLNLKKELDEKHKRGLDSMRSNIVEKFKSHVAGVRKKVVRRTPQRKNRIGVRVPHTPHVHAMQTEMRSTPKSLTAAACQAADMLAHGGAASEARPAPNPFRVPLLAARLLTPRMEPGSCYRCGRRD